MTDTKQPEALRQAARLRNVCAIVRSKSYPLSDLISLMQEAADTLERTGSENAALQQGYDAARLEIEARNKQLVKEAARTAEEKLRADRMTEQHRMQCQMREGLEREIEALRSRQCLHQIAEPAQAAPAAVAPNWTDAANWLRNNYQDYPNIASLCEGMIAASPFATSTGTPPINWENAMPGGKYTDKWESSRVADYNRGWNDYRKESHKKLKELTAATAAQAAPQPAPIFGDEDHVLVPRGLLSAACSAIDKKRDGVKTLAELRRYTTGDLSKAAPQPAPAAQEPIEVHEPKCPALIGDACTCDRRGHAYAIADMRSEIQNLEASRNGYRDDARALHDALTRMVAMYESEFDHEDTYRWRPDWLKSALARRNALEGNHDNQD